MQERGDDLKIVEYLVDPPDAQALHTIARQLELEPGEFIRTKEEAYAKLNLAAADDRERLLAAMASHPILIERPIVGAGDRARLGRPPEQVLEIL